MPIMLRDLEQVGMLIFQLNELGVELPADVVAGNQRLLRIHAFRSNPLAMASGILELDDEGMAALLTDVGVAYALDGSSGPGASAVSTVRTALMEALADRLLADADGILDQLRPLFDEAGRFVHEATALGIGPNTTDRDIVKADNVVAMRDAWTALPGLVSTLDRIASVRILLTRALGVPPRPTRAMSHAYDDVADVVVGAMFHPQAPEWRNDFEQTWQLWLRLCASEPVRLLTVEESIAATEGVHA